MVRKVYVSLSDEMAKRLNEISRKYGLTGLEEALRFSARFTVLTLEKLEERRRLNALVAEES